MPLSWRSRFWKFLLRNAFKKERLTVSQNRARVAGSVRFMPRSFKGVEVERTTINGLPAAWIRPSNANKTKVILHLHGGGYVVGAIDSHLMMCVPMARTLKTNLLLPEYRLAPEHPFPAALEDVIKIYHWLLALGYQSKDIILSGDSAGGGLSIAAAIKLREEKEAPPAALVCMSPWADLSLRGDSHATKERVEAVLTKEKLLEWASYYTGRENFTDPFVSPVFADLRHLPPMLIQVGSDEILLDDARMLADKAKADGVDVTLKIWDEMWHVWQALGELIPESKKAFEEIEQFIDSRMEDKL